MKMIIKDPKNIVDYNFEYLIFCGTMRLYLIITPIHDNGKGTYKIIGEGYAEWVN